MDTIEFSVGGADGGNSTRNGGKGALGGKGGYTSGVIF